MHDQSALLGTSGTTAKTRTPYGSTGSAQTQNASATSLQPASLAPLLIGHAGLATTPTMQPHI